MNNQIKVNRVQARKVEQYDSNEQTNKIQYRNKPKSATSRNPSISLSSNRNSVHFRNRPLTSQTKRTSMTINTHQLHHNLLKLKQTHQNSKSLAIRKAVQTTMLNKDRENKFTLNEVLQKIHPFFCKINRQISMSLLLLGKLRVYEPDTVLSFQNYDGMYTQCLDIKQNYVGLILYGKIELVNLTHFYSHLMNLKTLNTAVYEHNYIKQSIKQREKQKYEYDLRILEESCILWLSREVLYLIRKQCFLNMDLKYMFHEFENHLKYSLIHKKAKLARK